VVPFDRLLAVALAHFFREGVDLIILEVGIGGRYDSTNFPVTGPKTAVITNVSIDHTDFLGPDLDAIAWQKAGIILPGTHVYAFDREPLRGAIQRECASVGATFHMLEQPRGSVDAENASLAQAVVKDLGERWIPPPASWPCRKERVVVDLPDCKVAITLDGAHNPGSMVALCDRLAPARFVTIFGANGDKDVRGLLEPLSRVACDVFFVASSHPSAVPPASLLALAQQDLSFARAQAVPGTLEEALDRACACAALQSKEVLVCGSFYVCGAVRRILATRSPRSFDASDPVFLV
jgi:dihydrofolate synthase/folylpolyglutamate synthase